MVNKFACYSSEKALWDQSGCVDHSPVSLPWDIFSNPQHILKINGCCTVRSAPSHFITRKNETDEFMPRKSCFPGQTRINPGVLLFACFMALCLSCSERVKSRSPVRSFVPTGESSAVSSSVLTDYTTLGGV